MIKIAPSLASASSAHLEDVIIQLEKADADYIHFDIEDGNFVPSITLGMKMIKDLRPFTKLPFDVHLMVNNPEIFLPQLATSGANMVSVHFESCPYPRRTLGLISKYKMEAGLAFNPKTGLPPLQFCLPFLKFVVLLSTEPEDTDSSYLSSVLDKLKEGRNQKGLESVLWEVDGGITTSNIEEVKAAGADIVVSGRGIFSNKDWGGTIALMKKLF